VITGFGTKLCGEDAKAFCEARLDGVDSKNNVEACAVVGVSPPTEPQNTSETGPDYVPDTDTYAPNGDGDTDGLNDDLERDIEKNRAESCRLGVVSTC
jgi:hypothetical protein